MLIIGIAGGSGAGKTTVAKTIAERIGKEGVVYLSQDWYYKNHKDFTNEEMEKENLDHPNAFDTKLLVSHLKELKEGKDINVPVYDFKNHARTSDTIKLSPKVVLVLEGILVLAIEDLKNILDFRIYVNADPDIRLIRRMNRDINERGNSYDETIKRYLSSVKPMHDAFVEPSKRFADIVVPRGGENELATDFLADFAKYFINHKIINNEVD